MMKKKFFNVWLDAVYYLYTKNKENYIKEIRPALRPFTERERERERERNSLSE